MKVVIPHEVIHGVLFVTLQAAASQHGMKPMPKGVLALLLPLGDSLLGQG